MYQLFSLSVLSILTSTIHCASLPRGLCTEVDNPKLVVTKLFTVWLAILLPKGTFYSVILSLIPESSQVLQLSLPALSAGHHLLPVAATHLWAQTQILNPPIIFQIIIQSPICNVCICSKVLKCFTGLRMQILHTNILSCKNVSHRCSNNRYS